MNQKLSRQFTTVEKLTGRERMAVYCIVNQLLGHIENGRDGYETISLAKCIAPEFRSQSLDDPWLQPIGGQESGSAIVGFVIVGNYMAYNDKVGAEEPDTFDICHVMVPALAELTKHPYETAR